ncbi:MAG: ATP-binding cassette domain-containing protein, partial [Acidimicrobiales bacterium]
VGLEARHPTRFATTALATPGARRTERARRQAADELINFLGLGDYADSFVGELSTGTRRIVELAGLLANDARLLCLDEPAGGVAQRETEALGPLLVAIQRELDASMLVIEHDMPFLMGISHRVVALAEGQIIAAGTPDEVRHDPAVIDSYLGTDERAVARSGTIAAERGQS